MSCISVIPQAWAQRYVELREDGLIYDVEVIVFARQLSQPSLDTVNNKSSVKTPDVVVLPAWDRTLELMTYPEVQEPDSHSVPIDNQADPVNVLTDAVLDTSMNHPIINRLSTNPTYKPIYRQKWRQLPSPFLQPRYINVSNIKTKTVDMDDATTYSFSATELSENYPDYSIDGQVAFSKQRFTHLHVKMNLFRINSMNEQIVYELSQQKRIKLNQWQYFDHQQFGVLAKVTAIRLNKEE